MIIAILVLIAVEILLTTVTVVKEIRREKKIKLLEAKCSGAEKVIEALLDTDSKLTMNVVRLDERANMTEDKLKLIEKKIDDSAQAQEEAAAAIAKQIEKKWDNGLQNMLAWNPFGDGSEGN
jgi:hypothetical protein